MRKAIGPAVCVVVIAMITVGINIRDHARVGMSDIATYAVVGVIYGIVVMAVMFAIFLPLAWLLRRRRGPPAA
ncbi:MAG: hypothetical protein ACREEB_07940 [Caulobacteraceae bacterium]